MKAEILEVLSSLDESIKSELEGEVEATGYSRHVRIIQSLFSPYDTEGYGTDAILKRLVVIDSFYSTNASYSYFSMEEMADKIFAFPSERDFADYCYGIVEGGKDSQELFDMHYGIRKDTSKGRKQMSLLSKYVYYLLKVDKERYPLGFPIYDSLALKTYPKVCKCLGLKMNKAIEKDICLYVSALNGLRRDLFDDNPESYYLQQFDLLDAYLWRIGKISGGNYSLLLNRGSYEKFITILKLAKVSTETSVSEKSEREEEVGVPNKEFDAEVKKRLCERRGDVFSEVGNPNLAHLFKHWLELYCDQAQA